MITLTQFQSKAKVRYDFSDQFMVRFTQAGDPYDTWVSGEEALQRLKSGERERQIKGISQMDWEEMKNAGKILTSGAKKNLRRSLKDRLAGALQDTIGDNPIGDALADNIRGRDSNIDPRHEERQKWHTLLQNTLFRATLLEIAYYNLRATLPEEPETNEFDDWV